MTAIVQSRRDIGVSGILSELQTTEEVLKVIDHYNTRVKSFRYSLVIEDPEVV